MSYDIRLTDPVTKDVLYFDAPHQFKGGAYAIGGTNEAWLNITYNYSDFYRNAFGPEGIRTIYGKSGAESLPLLDKAIASLSNDVNPDYWKTTEGNAKRPLFQLKAMAQMRPDGIWEGD